MPTQSIYIVCCIFALNLIGNIQNAGAQVLFSDNFDDPAYTTANWSMDVGAWRTKGNTYNQDTVSTPNNFATVSSHTNFTAFTLTCDVFSSRDGGLIFRSDPSAMTGLALIASPLQGQLYFALRQGTGFSDILSTAPLNVTAGTNLHLTLTAQGNNFTATASLASNPSVALSTISLNDFPRTVNLTSGRVGVYETNKGAGEGFDNFTVTVPEPSTWTLCALGAVGGLGLARRRVRHALR